MRDEDYEKTPPHNTCRIALLGASHVEGWGVANDETFERLLEERLDQEDEERTYAKYESTVELWRVAASEVFLPFGFFCPRYRG